MRRRAAPGSLRAQLTILAVLVALLLLSFVGVAAGMLVRVHRTEQVVTGDLFTATRAGADSMIGALQQESGVSRYLLTAEAEHLEPYALGAAVEDAATRHALDALGDHPELRARFGEAADRLDRWRRDFADPALAAVDGGRPEAPDVEQGRMLFESYLDAYRFFEDDLLAVRDQAHDDFRAELQTLGGALAAAGAGIVLVTLALLVALRRWVTGPLAQLAGQTRAVAGGELMRAVEPVGPAEVAALAHDVESMRRRIVDELVDVAAGRRRLQEANTLLEQQAEELRRSNAELEQFAYVASHDLQEPLRKVASFCQLLEKRYAGTLDERADQYIAFAVDGAKRMQDLIQDLLAFSRVGRVGASRGPVDLTGCLERALRSLAVVLEETGAQVAADPLPTVTGDATLLTQVFQNLVGNAVKFRGAAVPRVRVTARRAGECWEISVRDNGIGIPEQYAEKVFVVFQRLHSRDEYEGTGIGLALCRKIVEYHGGRLWLVQPDGPGAELRFTLPAAETSGRGADGATGEDPR